MLRCFLLLMASLLACVPASARAQAGSVGAPISACVLRDAPGLSAAILLRAPGRFDCRTPQRDFGPGDFWVISGPLAIDATQSRGVRTPSLWQTRETLYALYADGTVSRTVADGHATTRNLQLGAILERRLPRHAAPLVRLLWHVEGSANLRGIVLAPTVASTRESSTSNIVLAAIYAGFAGICLALLLYNLGLARALPQAFLPFYCAMMCGMLLYAFSSTGALAWAFPGIDNNDRLRINYIALAGTGIAATLFLRHFFENGVIPRRLDRAIHIGCVAVALPAIGAAALGPWQLRAFDTAFIGGFAVLITMAVPMIVCAWRAQSRFLWLFIAAWSAPILLAMLRAVAGLDLIGYHFWLDNSTILSMAIEALLSSLAIAYRILLVTRERDAARAQEVAQRMLADIDPLTGLLNRRSFLREAIGRIGHQQLLLIDIDKFKRVNDTLGHDGGDEVLRLVARVLRGAGHAESLVARIGGEEFAVVTSLDSAIDAGAMLASLRGARMPFDLTVTASVGSCTGPLTQESEWKAMYAAADRALYAAKEAGRDRCREALAA